MLRIKSTPVKESKPQQQVGRGGSVSPLVAGFPALSFLLSLEYCPLLAGGTCLPKAFSRAVWSPRVFCRELS